MNENAEKMENFITCSEMLNDIFELDVIDTFNFGKFHYNT